MAPPGSSNSSFPLGQPPIAPPRQVSSEGFRGFMSGALRYSSISIALHLVLNRMSPVYRGLTIQFKIFLQLAAITLGGCICASRRVSDFNETIRRQQRSLERSQQIWSQEREMRAEMERRELKSKTGNEAEDV